MNIIHQPDPFTPHILEIHFRTTLQLFHLLVLPSLIIQQPLLTFILEWQLQQMDQILISTPTSIDLSNQLIISYPLIHQFNDLLTIIGIEIFITLLTLFILLHLFLNHIHLIIIMSIDPLFSG